MKWLLLLLFYSHLVNAAPPRTIPLKYDQEFTLHGQIPVSYHYRNDSYSSAQPLVYDFATVEALKKKALAKEEYYYGFTDSLLYAALDIYRSHVEGKKVAIIGSNIPWYEAIVLSYGGIPVTIEYNRIISQHPDLRVMTVDEFEMNPETFDAVISISSFEHDGLGRYGDPVNPKGDLEAMNKARKMLKEGGVLFLAVPVGKDLLVWNLHRIYGTKRLPMLFEHWRVLETFGLREIDLEDGDGRQPVFVLQPE